MTFELTFAEKFTAPIMSGRKCSTLRLTEVTDVPRVGDTVVLKTTGGRQYLEVKVANTAYVSVSDVVGQNIRGHRNYDTLAEVIQAFKGYYPSETIRPDSSLAYIGWLPDEVERIDV